MYQACHNSLLKVHLRMRIKLLFLLVLILKTTISSSSPSESSSPNEINTKLAGVPVTIYKTDSPPSGITFFLTGSMIPLIEYQSTIDVLRHERKQWVIGHEINVFNPPVKNNHLIKAYQVSSVFDAFCEKYLDNMTTAPHHDVSSVYNIIGHSVGGQIALLAESRFDDTNRIRVIVALDPVDENPSYFTNDQDDRNDYLHGSTFKIVMTLTDGGPGISTDHNAAAIHERNDGVTSVVRHVDAGHMAYTDHGGGVFGKLMPGGTTEGNRAAREGAQDLIRELI